MAISSGSAAVMAMKAEDIIRLTDQSPSWILDQTGRGHDMPTINTNTHPWAVLLHDNVYVKDTGTGSLSGEEIWQYSIKDNTWSSHPRPELLGFKRYTLTVFDSRLTCLGGFRVVRCKNNIEEYTDNKRVFAWNGHEWKDDDVEQIPEDVKLPSSDNELSASSDDTRLYLAWQKDDKVQIVQYSRERKWEKWEGPDCKSSGSRIEISVIKKTIFLTEHNDVVRTVIRKAAISSLSSSIVLSRNIWTEITWSTRLHDIGASLSFFSNLIVSGENILLLAPVLRSSSMAMLFNLSSDHTYWNKVGCLQISWKLDSHPSIFDLGNETLLIVGNTGNPLRASPKVCVYKAEGS